jgi:tetratricopeptide (TPR) repeat protein/DNA-binding CsgD family transcriptional regulator
MAFTKIKMKVILFLIVVFQAFRLSAQSNNPLLNWVKTHEHIELKKCIDTLQKAIKKSHERKQFQDESKYLQKLSHLFLTRIKNFDKTMACIEQIEDLAEESGDQTFLIDYYNQLGVTYYYEQLNMPKSFGYFKKALELGKKLKIESNISRTLSNYGLAYLQKDNYKTALSYFRKAIVSYRKEFKKEGTMEFYSNMGVAFIYAEKYDSASFYLNKSLTLARQTPSLDDDAERLMYLGVYNQEIGKNDEALSYLKEAFGLIHNLTSFQSKILVCEGLADAYAGKNEFKVAYDFRVKEKIYRDSLREVNLQENALSYLYKDELRQEKEKIQKVVLYVIILGVSLLLSLIILWLFISKNKVAQKNAEILLKNEQLEKEKVRLELENNERDVATKSMFLLEKDNLINGISVKLRESLPKLSGEAEIVINRILTELNYSVNNKSWNEFEIRFNKVHPNFMRNLERKFPKLSNNERKLCSFLLLNMSSKEISQITGQSVHSINIARSRLRSKLNLVNSGEELSHFLNTFT